MSQYQLEKAVARATGESVDLIRERGFNLMFIPIAYPRTDSCRRATARKQAAAVEPAPTLAPVNA
jgi:hypothetical protein